MLSFLKTCGQSPLAALSDADRLALAQMAYFDFSAAQEGMPLPQALATVPHAPAGPTEQRFFFQQRHDTRLCEALRCPRYDTTTFVDFTSAYSPEEECQFAALTLDLPTGERCISFRGSDNTLSGWKEDFALAFEEQTPAQALALAHTSKMARDGKPLVLLGHSKGGNLALYSAVYAPLAVQERIVSAVSLDGPGLSGKTLASPEYLRVQSRLRLIRPQASLIGLLFHQPENVRIVQSRAVSFAQHYLYFWKTENGDLCDAPATTPAAEALGCSLQGMIDAMPLSAREAFTEAVFGILAEAGAETFVDMAAKWPLSTACILGKLLTVDPETRALLFRVIRTYFLCLGEALGLESTTDLWNTQENNHTDGRND